jgi:hypothetical protein
LPRLCVSPLFCRAGGSSQGLCIAQNELKQGLLLNRNFVNAVKELKMIGAQNENVPAEII